MSSPPVGWFAPSGPFDPLGYAANGFAPQPHDFGEHNIVLHKKQHEDIGMVIWFVTIVITVGVAYTYKKKITDRRPVLPAVVPSEYSMRGRTFKYDLFDFSGTYCLYGFFCPSCRIADNYAAAGFGMNFVVVATILAVIGLPNMDFRNPMLWVTAVWLAFMRRRLRARFGFGETSCAITSSDFISYFFCLCCTVLQDARQIDEATGTRVECCLELVQDRDNQAPLLGQLPVQDLMPSAPPGP